MNRVISEIIFLIYLYGVFVSDSFVCSRWRMHLIKESGGPKSDSMTKNSQTGSVESVQDAPVTDRVSGSSVSTLSRPRETLNVGPISIAPNTSYIKRLEHNRGIIVTTSSTSNTEFSLPALKLRDNGTKKAPRERGIAR